MNIDILNAYCGFVLVANPPLCQGRLKLTSIRLAVLAHGLPALSCLWARPGCAHEQDQIAAQGLAATALSDSRGELVSLVESELPNSPWLASWVSARVLEFFFPSRPPAAQQRWLALQTASLAFGFPIFLSRPDIKGGYPPNLSILISGGKENNSDSLSNGE